MRILGISAHYHDAAAALVIDGMPVCAIQEERLSRSKNDASFPLRAIEWCLDVADLSPEDLDAVVFYEKPLRKAERILVSALREFPRSWRSFPRAMKSTFGEKVWVRGIITARLGVRADRILFTEHHQAHAAAAFLTAPTTEAAILTADGVGEWATATVGRGVKRDDGSCAIELWREVRFPHSLGLFYSTFTAFLGFEVNEGEYKVMGLAAYGRPRYAEQVRALLQPTADGAFALDLSYFDFHAAARRSWSQRLVRAFGAPRPPGEPLDLATPDGARWADLASSVQRVLEDAMVRLASELHRESGLADLCLGGGVALNGCANARVLRESGFSRVFVPPAPGDAGCALGAALWADRIHFRRPHRPVPDHAAWGCAVDGEEVARIAAGDGLVVEPVRDDAALLADVAAELARGRLVGWLDGRCELGPRALGHRSILAAPWSAETRDRINREVKFREEFRPFAPAVPRGMAARYFELPPGGERLGRFMSGVFPVRPEWRERLAAVTHVDGTARVQTVDPAVSPRFHALLLAFGALTGVPVLLNTSFNLSGEPIVARGAEGYVTFRRSGLDLLVAGASVVRKRQAGDAPALGEVAR